MGFLSSLGDPNTNTVRGFRAVLLGLGGGMTATGAALIAVYPRIGAVVAAVGAGAMAFGGALGAGEKNTPDAGGSN